MALLPRGYLSHSQIRLYNECPQKYCFAYVDAVPCRRNEKVFLGEVYHATLENYFTRLINGCRQADDETIAFFSDTFSKSEKEGAIDWQIPRRETMARGKAFVMYFLAHLAPTIKPLLVEKELSAEIPGSGITIKGVIDLIETDFSITDFKTTTSKWSSGRARHSLQMTIYKYLFEQNFAHSHAALKYEILYAKKAATIRHQSMPVFPGPDEISRLLDLIGRVAENIGEGSFHPVFSPGCAYCEYAALCREKHPGGDPARKSSRKSRSRKP